MKYVRLAYCFLLFPTAAVGQTFSPPPFVFQPNTPANASQMMANFQAFINNGNAVSIDLNNRISSKQPFPSGTIAFFNLSTCPVGWTLQSSYSARYIRGLDLGRGKDPSNALGQLEADQNQGHKHSVTASLGKTGVASNVTGIFATGTFIPDGISVDGSRSLAVDSGSHGTEMRPNNVALLICKKN